MEETWPWDLPERLILGWSLVAFVIGDLVSRRPSLSKWVIPINAVVSVIVSTWWYGAFSAETVFMGLTLGLAPTGLHKFLQQLGIRKKG